MQITSARKTLVAATATVLIGAGGLVGCGEATSDQAVPVKSANTLQKEAEILFRKAQFYAKTQAYAGDPWEKRFREQFWSTQHIHDSWNRCHLGENVPRELQQGPGC